MNGKNIFPRSSIYISGAVVAFIMWGVSAYAGDMVQNKGLAPHRAVYALQLIGKKSDAQILNINGQTSYAWQSECAAWTAEHKTNIAYEYTDGSTVRVQNDFSTYEQHDGSRMSFWTEKKRGGIVFEKLQGQADVHSGLVTYQEPEGLQHDLSQGTLFPMQHTLAVLDQMAAGKRFFAAHIFDGSNQEGSVFVNTFLGRVNDWDENISKGKDLDQSLLSSPMRHAHLAFYSAGGEDQSADTPDYEMSVNLHDNGVISHMVAEYEDFTIEQNLIRLEKQDNTCAEDISSSK